jgi:eukaryotic-like serine/threonine-protein kinase
VSDYGSEPTRIAHFRILGRLGSGGMGVVHRAEDETLRRTVALKVLAGGESDGDRRLRFLREARSAAAITHPNVATVYQVGESQGCIYIAMELVDGESLRSWLDRGPVDAARARDLALQIARGLAAAHEHGIVHRDLKPENVMVTGAGGVKLLDFGLAKGAPDSGRAGPGVDTLVTAESGLVMGTPAYMSPEQALGKTVDVRSDVFSFGTVLYEMLCGARPFPGDTGGILLVAIVRDPFLPLPEHVQRADPALAAVVARCLAKAPDDRFADARELVAALGGGASPKAVTISRMDVAPVAASTPTRSGAPRRPAAWLRSIALAALVLLGLLTTAWLVLVPRLHRPDVVVAPASPEAAADARPIRLMDLPAPKTDSKRALAEYERAMSDFYDATRSPQTGFGIAVQEDPSFAAAHLRETFRYAHPIPMSFRDAMRYRDRLDDRDREILHAEEPLDAREVSDFAESERRFEALAKERPRDEEILLALGRVQSLREPGAGLATFQRLAALDPGMARAELEIGLSLEQLGWPDDALAHYRKCSEISPQAGLCILQEGIVASRGGHCDLLASAVRRSMLSNDIFTPLYRLDAALTTGEPRPNADAIAETLVLHPLDTVIGPGLAGAKRVQFHAEIALWFGDFAGGMPLFEQATRDAQENVEATMAFPGFHQELVVAEEMSDEARARELLARYVARRGSEPADWDALALRAMRLHRALPEASLEKLRDRWRQELARYPDSTAFWQWFRFDAAWALSPEEARSALAMTAASEPWPASLDLDDHAILGHLLLLAERPAEAAAHLEQAALACVIYRTYTAYVPTGFVTRAAFDLGKAREALGDAAGACDAYGRVMSRWGDAKPRSLTADGARARMKVLACR